MQELGKFNPKINVIPNGVEKYMNFSTNNNLSVIGSFQFQRPLLESLTKNFGNNGFKYFSQEFGNNLLDLFKQK